MDDCDIEPTPNDPEFDPYECESTYALWAFKEEGEPVKFLEASLVENPDCPSGYSFCWRTLSLCDRTGKLVDRFGGDIGDVSRADYIADTVLPGGAVSSQVEDDSLPNLPYSIAESTEAVPAFYRIDNPAMPDDPLTRDMLADALQSVENSHRSAAMDALLCNRHGMDVAKRALIASAVRGMQSSGELFDMMSRAVGLIRATEGSAAGVGDYALAQSLLSTGLHHMQNRCFDTVTRDPADTRFMDTSKVTKLFAEELERDTGLALDAALKGKHARHYSRDAYALIFTEADLDEYAELIDLDCPDLDAKQRREVAATAVREWCRDHAMDGFSVFFHDYAKEYARSAAEKQAGGIRH